MAKKRRASSARRSTRREAESEFSRIERPLTLVAQVEQTLRRAVRDGVFPGGRLPTAVALAEQLGVSRETVRLALDALQRDGLLVKRRRRGTFVNPPRVPGKLPAKPSHLIGYLQADYGNEQGESESVVRGTSSQMFEGALHEAGLEDFQLIVRSARLIRLGDSLSQLNMTARLRGVIFASLAEEKVLKRFSGLNIPAVLLDHDLHLPKLDSIRPDGFGRAKLAVRHLAELGHRRIALAHWHQQDLNPWLLRGYREGMRDAKLRCRRAWELFVPLSLAGAAETVRGILESSPRPTAVICFHNALAHHTINEAERCGLRVPQDLSVIGGGGTDVLGLTCTQLDWHELGREAMRMLLRAIKAGEAHRPEHKRVMYHLHVGGTTAPSPKLAGNSVSG